MTQPTASGNADVVLEFEPPADPISMNEGDSWKVRKSAKLWRERAYWAWCEAHPGQGPSGRVAPTPGVVRVVLPFPVSRGRDPINYAKTVKHIVDGITDAGAWPNDTPDYVAQEIPTLSVGTKLVVVRVSPAE